ncbi:MAG: exodeoxyribonuclease VII large subunit, partial [Caulobacteraceae bacterium]|nr:exodeoxyribonuclease VII large subunit [Caulobacter sp.]
VTLRAERVADLAARLDRAATRAGEAAARRARLPELGARLEAAAGRRLSRSAERLAAADALLRSLDPDRPLERGFARVHHVDGRLARRAADLAAGEAVKLRFADGARGAVIDGASREAPAAKPPRQRAAPSASAPASAQGDLF